MNNKETTKNMLNTTRKFQSFSEFLNEERQKKLQKKMQKRFLIESEEVLSEFEKEFPREIVRADPKERPLEVTEENMRKIFRILNKMFFDGKLKEIPMKGMTLSEMIRYFSKKLNRRVNIHKIENALGNFLNESEANYTNKTYEILPNTEIICMQLLSDRKVSFGYAVAIIMHEMIHYYDSIFGNLLNLQYLKNYENKPFNEHVTQIFKEYMDKAHNKDILVKVDGNGRQYIELNKEAQEYFQNLPVGEIKSESKENDSEKNGRHTAYKLENGRILFWYY